MVAGNKGSDNAAVYFMTNAPLRLTYSAVTALFTVGLRWVECSWDVVRFLVAAGSIGSLSVSERAQLPDNFRMNFRPASKLMGMMRIFFPTVREDIFCIP